MNIKPMSYDEWKQQAKDLLFKTEQKVAKGLTTGTITRVEFNKIVKARVEINQILLDMEV